MSKAKTAAGEKDVHIMGGADIIRQALAAGVGVGKRLVDGFVESLDLEQIGVRQSPLGTFIDYRVKR